MKKYTLPKEFGEKWIAALRSGKYKKIKGRFMDVIDGEACYCSNGLAYKANCYKFTNTNDLVDVEGQSVSIWNGLKKLPIKTELIDAIVDLNDGQDKSFPEIADWIEANVELN